VKENDLRIVPAGDAALVIELPGRDDVIDPSVNARAIAIAESISAVKLAGIRDVVPAYRSVSVFFDPLRTEAGKLSAIIDRASGSEGARPDDTLTKPIEVPVCYGGEWGPDLEAVASFAALSPAEVIEIHSTVLYRVFMLGFFPGFAYMGIVDPRIAAPRHQVPRVRVSSGSIGLAGQQTGIYPYDTPGGWQVIGKTPVKPLDLKRVVPFLFNPGDLVRFVPIDVDEYHRLSEAE
jgi:inhibitor of KinA